MVGPVQEVVYQSADDFIRHLLFEQETSQALPDGDSIRFVFRGERSAHPDFRLLPAMLRSRNKTVQSLGPKSDTGLKVGHIFLLNEFRSLYRFYVTANKNGFALPEISIFKQYELNPKFDPLTKYSTWIPEELFEIAGLAQHYGVPTRLLDWTFNPFTALYFAAIGAVENFYNAAKESFVNGERFDAEQYENEEVIVVWALHIDDINQMNKEYPDHEVKWIRPPYNRNPNLTAQLGLFTHVQQKYSTEAADYPDPDKTPLDELLKPISANRPFLFRHMLPIREANRTLTQLQRLQHTASKIFPGLGGVAKEVIDQEKREAIKDYWKL